MSNFNWSQFWVVAILFLLIGGGLAYAFLPRATTSTSTGNATKAQIDAAVTSATTELNGKISNLTSQIASLKAQQGIQTTNGGTVVTSNKGYLLDSLYLDQPYSKLLTSRQINLFDGQVYFNGKNYNAKESLSMNAIQVKANNKDFDGNVYLTAPQKSISYTMTFSPTLITSSIGQGDNGTLSFNFLGKPAEISSWTGSQVTFIQGTKVLLKEGQNVSVDGKNIQLVAVGSNNKIVVSVNGVIGNVNQGQTSTINGEQVMASDIFPSSNTVLGQASLIIGKTVQTDISSGDTYSGSNFWRWQVNSTSIGLVLSSDFTQLDGTHVPLKAGQEICLPSNYTCVMYNGATATYENYNFISENQNFTRVEGSFIKGIDSYTEVFIQKTNNATSGTIYFRDNTGHFSSLGHSVGLGNSNSTMTTNSENISINDLRINLGLTNSSSKIGNWSRLDTIDNNYRTLYGIFVDNPKTSAHDQSFSIKVPDDKLQGTLTIKDIGYISSAPTNSTK